MRLKNSRLHWGMVAIFFHWFIVILVGTQFYLIYHFDQLPRHAADKIPTILLHKSVGMTILAIVVLRLLWRLANTVPSLPADLSWWLKLMAKANHFLLYARLFIVPATGYLMTGFSGRSLHVFGVAVPMLVSANKSYSGLFSQIHSTCAFGFLGLICLHFTAVMYHQFIRKDSILSRMLPWGKQ